MAIADLGWTTGVEAVLEMLKSRESLSVTDHLHVAVHGLASRAVHDDVDAVVRSALRLLDDTSIATDGSEDFILGSSVWDLRERQGWLVGSDNLSSTSDLRW